MGETAHRYFIINKPYDMVSQFVSSHGVRLLGDLQFNFPEGIHAIGRLDNHSEGLLILTTNKRITRLLFLGEVPHKRTYLVQVNNVLSEENLHLLQNGITIRVKGGTDYITPPCNVAIVDHPEHLYKYACDTKMYGQHTWLLITLTEGKFHQVRKMLGAIHHRCKRLIRISIEDLALNDLAPGEVQEIEEDIFLRKLNICLPQEKP
ncbi:MAG: rRNA pseudouridine synthase [Ferruginibacter sp.]|nr:rRNA pseudouridine synthase [Ferruginibacter sp.]